MELVDLTGVRVRGHALDVRIEGERLSATLDGVRREGRVGAPMDFALPP
jgi:hypothetical protein